MEERRLIDEGTLDGAARKLLLAGRAMEPPAASRQRLLQALLPDVGAALTAAETPSASPGAAKAGGMGKAGIAASSAGGALPWAALAVLGVAAIGASYALGSPAGGPPEAVRVPPATLAAPASPVRPADEPQVPAREWTAQPVTPSQINEPAPSVMELPKARSAAAEPRGKVTRAPAPARSVAPLPVPVPRTALDTSGAASTTSSRTTAAAPPTVAPPAAPPEIVRSLPPSAPADTQLAEELRELENVRQALLAGDQSAASALLAAYFRRFPGGYLAPEARRLEARVCVGTACRK